MIETKEADTGFVLFTERAALHHLKELHIDEQKRKYQSLPYFSSPDFKVSTANGLTKAAIHFLKLNGAQAERISSTGRYLDNSLIVENVIGQRRILGSGKWIPGSSTKGTADISATIKNSNGIGISVKIEVKIGKDRQSEAQKKYQLSVENAGGVYKIISSLADLINWYYKTFANGATNKNRT